eukprot:COSAG01_NODE_70885_length_257_cov_0.981013_2_plen_22_part_01
MGVPVYRYLLRVIIIQGTSSQK